MRVHLLMLSLTAAILFPAGQPKAGPEAPTDFQETPVILDAAELLPGDLLKGPDFQVDRRVENDGYVNVYTVTSKNGSMTVEGTAALRERINELNALRHMEALQGTQLFTDALKEGVKAPLKTAKGLVTEPVETVKGAATGIGRWFSDMGRAIVSDDPDQDNVLKTAIGYSTVKRKFAYEYRIDPYTR